MRDSGTRFMLPVISCLLPVTGSKFQVSGNRGLETAMNY